MEGLVTTKSMPIDQAFWADKRVLITGHTGFKGAWLSLWLLELGANVTGIGLAPETSPSLFDQLRLDQRVHCHHTADIRCPEALVNIVESCQPDVVFRLAAQPLVKRSYSDPLNLANVQGSLNLLESLNSRGALAPW